MSRLETLSDESAVASTIRTSAQRGLTALSLYAPGAVNADAARALIQDILTLAVVRGWNEP